MTEKRKRGKMTRRGSLARADEIARAVKLVRSGMTVRDASRIMNIALGKAYNLLSEGRQAITEDAANDLLAEVVDRQRAVIRAHWAKRSEPEHARVIQLSDKVIIATLPTKTEISGKDGGPIVSYDLSKLTDAQLDRLIAGDASALGGGDAVGPEGSGEGGEGTPPA
jgi:hypothetical protein